MRINKFVIGGERRSGSSSLYEILKKHSQVNMFAKSDFDFFIESELFSINEPKIIYNWADSHSLQEYHKFFNSKNINAYKDADLLWWHKSHKRIAEYDQECKFLFILREPIKRAESHFMNELSKGREQNTFEEAIAKNENELSDWQRLHLCYRDRGYYAKSLKHFYKYIDKSRVKVIILEELFAEWEIQMKEICDFLNIDSNQIQNLQKKHSNKESVFVRKNWATAMPFNLMINLYERFTEAIVVRSSNQKDIRSRLRKQLRFFYQTSYRDNFFMDGKVRKELEKYYMPLNKELEELLGKEVKYWNYD